MITPFGVQQSRLPFAPAPTVNPLLNVQRTQPVIEQKKPAHELPDLPRSLNFYADYSGCGHWRMIWPEKLLNCYGKANIQGGTVMIGDKNFYKGFIYPFLYKFLAINYFIFITIYSFMLVIVSI
mgnify:CR=1 FL=1